MIDVLDTNAVSALMKGNAAVVERLAATEPTDIDITQPVLAEIAFGIERLPGSRRRSALQERFDLICSELPRAEWTDAVSHSYGRVKATWSAAARESRISMPRSWRMLSRSARHS